MKVGYLTGYMQGYLSKSAADPAMAGLMAPAMVKTPAPEPPKAQAKGSTLLDMLGVGDLKQSIMDDVGGVVKGTMGQAEGLADKKIADVEKRIPLIMDKALAAFARNKLQNPYMPLAGAGAGAAGGAALGTLLGGALARDTDHSEVGGMLTGGAIGAGLGGLAALAVANKIQRDTANV